jgi:hypothetical protein
MAAVRRVSTEFLENGIIGNLLPSAPPAGEFTENETFQALKETA